MGNVKKSSRVRTRVISATRRADSAESLRIISAMNDLRRRLESMELDRTHILKELGRLAAEVDSLKDKKTESSHIQQEEVDKISQEATRFLERRQTERRGHIQLPKTLTEGTEQSAE
jgi:hypothetical protein